MNKIIRTSTIPASLNSFCRGLLTELRVEEGYEVVAVSSPGAALDEVAQREGVKSYAVPMRRDISLINDLNSLWGLIKVFRKEKPAMVHSMTPKAGLLSMMAGWFCQVPVRVHTFTGLVFPTTTGLKQKILIFTDRLTCACATHIIPEGEGVKGDLQRFKITKKPLKVLGYGNVKGIDLKWFDPELTEVQKEASKIRKDGVFTFVSLGRLVGDKGINELVEAYTKIHAEFPATRLILVGPEERELDPLKPETIKTIESEESIEAIGGKKDVRPWYAAADALVFPSYREGFPNVVIEAGAMNLPSIVTDINGSNEIIIEGENGMIVPSKDAKALEDAMRSFIENPERTKAMGAKARPLVASRYEQSYVRQCLKDFYREILGREGSECGTKR